MDQKAIRETLEALAQTLESRLARIASHHQRTPDADSEERAQELENEEVIAGLESGGARELAQVRAALSRLDAGTYGTCGACGEAIDEARLEAVPFTDVCIGCAERAEAS